MSDTVLKLENITKFFPGIKALDGVHLNIRPGEVHALIGENGAGKSTLVKILTGVHPPTSGRIIYKDQESSFRTATEAQDAGITAIHQEASMFPELSVTENIYMGHHLKSGKIGALSWRQMRKKNRRSAQKNGAGYKSGYAGQESGYGTETYGRNCEGPLHRC